MHFHTFLFRLMIAFLLSYTVTASPLPDGAAGKPHTLQIFYTESADEISGMSHTWDFYTGRAGVGVNPCKSTPIRKFPAPNRALVGKYDVTIEGKNCTFRGYARAGGNGAVGYLQCGAGWVGMCLKDGRKEDKCGLGSTAPKSKAVTYCGY